MEEVKEETLGRVKAEMVFCIKTEEEEAGMGEDGLLELGKDILDIHKEVFEENLGLYREVEIKAEGFSDEQVGFLKEQLEEAFKREDSYVQEVVTLKQKNNSLEKEVNGWKQEAIAWRKKAVKSTETHPQTNEVSTRTVGGENMEEDCTTNLILMEENMKVRAKMEVDPRVELKQCELFKASKKKTLGKILLAEDIEKVPVGEIETSVMELGVFKNRVKYWKKNAQDDYPLDHKDLDAFTGRTINLSQPSPSSRPPIEGSSQDGSKALSRAGHLNEHNGENPHNCNICSKTFYLPSNMNVHMKLQSGEKPQSCSICSKAFSQAGHLKGHLLTHTGEKPHSCNICSKVLARASDLKKHMLTHTGEKPHSCSICSKAFSQARYLKKHVLRHNREKPHSCHLCNKAFSQAIHLKLHMIMHTGEKPHCCSICSKAFSQARYLKKHVLCHNREKPHSCHLCNKAFSQASNLKEHMIMHTGEKPHCCSMCSKAFGRMGDLKTHMLTHTEEKPHSCSICSKAFSQARYIKKHMRTHIGEKPHS